MIYSMPAYRTLFFFLTLLPTLFVRAMDDLSENPTDTLRGQKKVVFDTLASLGYKYCKKEGDTIICSRKFLKRKDDERIGEEEIQISISPKGSVKRHARIACDGEFIMQPQDNRISGKRVIWTLICCGIITYGSYKLAKIFGKPDPDTYEKYLNN